MNTHPLRLILILLAVTVIPSGCGDKIGTEPVKVQRQEISGVVISRIEPVEMNDFYEAAGTIRAKVTSAVSSRVTGRIMEIPVKVGDRVRAGQVLMRLDDGDAVQKVKAAEQALTAAGQNKALAESTYARYRKLYEGKALTGQEFEEIGTRKKVADSEYARMEAALQEAKVYQGYAVITSPASGLLSEKKIETGSMAAPGIPLMVVESGSGFNIEAYIDEILAGRIHPGMRVNVRIDTINFNGKGTVSEIVPAVDPATRTFLIKAAIAAPGLKSGLYARIQIPLGMKTVIAAPIAAVIEKGQLTGVYAVSAEGVITYRLVRLGKTFDDSYEVLSGLKAGDRIIVSGLEKAVDGGVVREAKAQ